MRKQTMRMLSVLLCVLITVSSFSVLTAFAAENDNVMNTTTDNSKNSTVVDVDGHKYGTGDLGKSDDDNTPTIKSESQYYSIVAKEEGVTKAKAKAQALDGDNSLPSKVDNSQSKYFPPIGNQGSVGSCAAWASTYYQFTYAQNKALNRTASYNNSFSPLWVYNFANASRDIGLYTDDPYLVLKNIGVPTLKNSQNITDSKKWTVTKEAFNEAQKYKLNKYYYIDANPLNTDTPITSPNCENINKIKAVVNNDELVTFSTKAYGFKRLKISKDSRVPENAQYEGQNIVPYLISTSGGHRMTIVGYDDDIWVDINEDGKVQDGEKGAFKVANSWGSSYDNKGFIWMSYDAINRISSVNDKNLSSKRVYFDGMDYFVRINVKPVSSSSNINLEYTLNSKSRNDIKIKVTAKNKNTGKTFIDYSEPFKTYNTFSVANDYSFDGTNNYSTGTFTTDLNSIVPNINSNNVDDYTWTFNFQDTTNNDSTLTVSNVKIVDNNENKTYNSDLNGTAKLNGSSKDITVNSSTVSNKNLVTIYYKGYSTPYIHYQVGNGNWTQVPGKAMTPDTTVDGFTHTYTINLGTSSYANVCFNDGNNNWDSRNGQNYHFEKGTYTFKNGTITPITVDNELGIESFDLTPADGKVEVGEYFSMNVKLKNATSSVVNKFTYVDSDNHEITIYDYAGASGCSWYFNKAGTYKVRVYSKDGYGASGYVMAEKTVYVSEKKLKIDSIDLTPADGKITAGDSVEIKVNLKNATNSAVNKFTYVDPNNNECTIYDYSQALSCKKQFTTAGTYKVRVYSKESYSSTEYVMAEKTVVVSPKKEFRITSASVTPSDYVLNKDSFGISVAVADGVEPYQYEYGYTQDGKTKSATSTGTYYSFTAEKGGVITPYVKVTDATGKTLSKTFSPITVKSLTINSIETSPQSPQYVGTKITLKADIVNARIRYGMYGKCDFVISKNGKVVETLSDVYSAKVDWTPTEEGYYSITCNVSDYFGQQATKTINYVINKKNTADNVATIYYTGYNTPYIHYQVEGGSWTNAPGYKMSATSEMTGFTHKYVINLGNKSYANVCFNDGNGNWDSKNGQNYKFYAGTSTFKNGVITKVEKQEFGIESFTLNPADGKITVGDSIEMNVKLKNADSFAVSKFTYVDSSNNEHQIYDYSGAKGCSWQFNKAGTYKVRVYSKTGYGANGYVMAEKTVTVSEPQPLNINLFSINSNSSSVPFCDYVNMTANVSGGKAPYQYEFSVNQYNTTTVLQSFSTKNTCSVMPEYVGNYNYVVTVKDATGAIVTAERQIYVAQTNIASLNANSSSVKVNDTVSFSADIKNLSSLVTYKDYVYTITKDGKTETLTTNSDRTANWTPKEAGTYKLLLQIKYNGKYIAGRSVEITVDKASENVVTIYYKGYSTPYIHYQVENGSWTQVPGVAMTATSEKVGYTHKYTINLGTSSYANVCFNNGNGSWDSRNGQNYHFEKGAYTFSNGQMTKISN